MSPLMKPSTRQFTTEARRLKGFSFWDWLHGYFYITFPYAYIGNAMGERRPARFYMWLVRQWQRVFPARPQPPAAPGTNAAANSYHGKVIPLETARQLVSIKAEISISYPEKVIPYPLARDLILQHPDHITVMDCPCRAARANPCQPLDVCLIVGEPFASLVTEHHPRRSRAITSAEAVEILEAEERRGHVHHAFFKDAMLGRFYAVCNCCSCCCGAMQAQRQGTPMLASSGYLSQVDEDRCLGCGECEQVCPFEAIAIVDGLSRVNEARCMGCGVCVSLCSQGALSLSLAPERGEPMRLEM